MASSLQAWYRRGKVNSALGNYKDAVDDLNIAKNFELSLGGKRQIESELEIIVDSHGNISSGLVQENANCLGHLGNSFHACQLISFVIST